MASINNKNRVQPLRKIPKKDLVKASKTKLKIRKHITLSKEVRDMLVREYPSYRSSLMADCGHPYVYLLGEDGKHVVRDYERLMPNGDGCGEMPSVTANELSNAYIRLAKRSLTPCAIARVGVDFDNNNLWGEDSGGAIYMKDMHYVLSYDGHSFTACTVKDKKSHSLYREDYDPDYDDYDEYGDNLVELEVRIGK